MPILLKPGIWPTTHGPLGKPHRSVRFWGRLLGWVVPLGLALSPVQAAERISLSYGLLERTISLETLQQFAAGDEVPRDLRPYTRHFTPEQVEQFRQLLNTQFELSPVAIAQFLYTDQGGALLDQLGEVVRTESGLSGARALRAALVLAAFDTDYGLTPLTVLQQFPLDGLQIDLTQTSQIVAQVQQQVTQTQQAIATIETEATEAIATDTPPNYDQLPNLERQGSFGFQIVTFDLNDPQRHRTFAVDLYLPLRADRTPPPTPAPIVVISHGLGSNRNTFAYLARHLVSYGLVVAVPEHPGSNTQQLEDLIEGRARQVTEPTEFIDRPLDITRLLDELERRAQQDPTLVGRYDTQQVGVLGQSLGGYTAFALAGVPLDRTQLLADCANTNSITFSLNLSLLLQCDVLNLNLPDYLEFQDDRVKAILSINTVGSSLLERRALAQVQIPVMVVSGGADTVTPSLPEQIRPFSRLTVPDRYLLMMENATHFSAIDIPPGDTATITLPTELIGPNPAIAHQYLNAFSLAFFGYYLQHTEALQPYLAPAYARYLSQPALPIELVRSFPPTLLLPEQPGN